MSPSKPKIKDVQAAMVSYLKGNTSMFDVCGKRGYKDVAKQDSDYPFFVVDQISQVPERDTQGATGIDRTVLQVSTWSRGSKDRQRCRAALRAALEEIPRNMSGAYVYSTDVEYQDTQEPSEDKSEGPVFRTRADIALRHRQKATTRS